MREKKKKGKGGKVKLKEGKKETNTRVNEMNGGVSGGRARGEDFAANERKVVKKVGKRKQRYRKQKCGDSMGELNDADANAIRGVGLVVWERILCPKQKIKSIWVLVHKK